ncbi:oligosaccharide flippase family protein [Rhodococcus ruber]|uniref:oligosaccharide flippase family protein n=1 Tax=Rhodococcus ruber TaxID=1830 RepID=UPI000932E2E0|nr:oligosaccharide flippase family protein [Rhodococcus ruber]AWH00520.1 hypothetical protein DCN13_19115 [Rhodococcus ruber]
MSGPILAHAMGPEGRGQFAGIMQPITVASAVASLGVPSAVAYYVARRSDPRATFALGIRTTIAPLVVVIAVMIVYAQFVSERQGIPYRLLLLFWSAIILSVIVQIRRGVWQGLATWRLLDFERGAAAILRFALVIAVALVGWRHAGAFAAGALSSFVIASMLLFAKLPRRVRDAENALPGEFAKFSVFASIGTISTIASSRLDQLLMPAASNSDQLGYYAVAVTVAEVPLVFATLAARNALQRSAKNWGNRRIAADTAAYFGVCVVTSIAIGTTAQWLAPIVFGASFEPSVLSMQILSAASVATWIAVVSSAIMSGRGYPGYGSLIPLISFLVTVGGFTVLWGDVTSYAASLIALMGALAGSVVGGVLLITFKDCRVPSSGQ